MSDGITEARKGFSNYNTDGPSNKTTPKTYIFRVKVEKHSTSEFKIEQDGFLYVVTEDPSKIYQHLSVDSIISVEKISHCYVIE